MDLQRFLTYRTWPKLTPALARTEVLAGLTVALVMVPQAVAYAGLAGMPLVTGLYTCLVPALLAVLLGSANRLSVGPAALTCVLIGASLTGMAEPGSAEWVSLAVWLSLLSGGIQLLLGLGHYGWLINLVSSPVMMGFTQAASLLIMASQVPALLGVKTWQWDVASWSSWLTDWPALFGLGSLAVLLLLRRYKPRWPGVMLVMALASLLGYVTGYEQHGAVVGLLPSGLPDVYWPHWPGLEMLNQLWVPAMVIALVSFLETASSARIECQRDGKRWDDSTELFAQGLAKLASAFSGSFPTSTSFSRSALMLYAGARSGWAVVASVGFVLLALLLLMPALQYVPRSVMAAAVIVAVLNLFQPRQFLKLWRIDRVETMTAAVTFAITLATAPRIYWGVMAGVLVGLSHFLHTRLHPRIIEVGLHPDGSLRDRHLWKLPPLAPHLYALRMDAELDFAAASGFERAIAEHLALHPDVQDVCLFAQPINRIDATGVETFGQLQRQLASRGITLHISGIKLPVETALKRAGELPESAQLKLYRTDADALQALRQLAPLPNDIAAAAI
ncbi:SulP family inorganic anion transporter [Limnohabitans lacus]|jgi:sulfate permease, SulP family|uniref:SulP family inorganic anion transporter n=1 Tax=Limnohabitans lacus TaxID=3045173 RepID=A0ABT6X9K4_9BURK|nr:SulP family inorganic anion transporter [Limnohabitans sp. HM2-2]MDI9234765.1 SulP family inorganic anion transporter [Limnohabitans sp. HM2-2]